VGDTIGVRLVELMDVWEGRDPEPPGLEERLGEMVDELRTLASELRLSRHQQEEATTELMRALGALARGGLIRRGTPSENGEPDPAGSRRS